MNKLLIAMLTLNLINISLLNAAAPKLLTLKVTSTILQMLMNTSIMNTDNVRLLYRVTELASTDSGTKNGPSIKSLIKPNRVFFVKLDSIGFDEYANFATDKEADEIQLSVYNRGSMGAKWYYADILYFKATSDTSTEATIKSKL